MTPKIMFIPFIFCNNVWRWRHLWSVVVMLYPLSVTITCGLMMLYITYISDFYINVRTKANLMLPRFEKRWIRSKRSRALLTMRLLLWQEMSDFVSYTAAEEALIVCLINSVGSVTYLSIGQCSLCCVRVRLAALHQQYGSGGRM